MADSTHRVSRFMAIGLGLALILGFVVWKISAPSPATNPGYEAGNPETTVRRVAETSGRSTETATNTVEAPQGSTANGDASAEPPAELRSAERRTNGQDPLLPPNAVVNATPKRVQPTQVYRPSNVVPTSVAGSPKEPEPDRPAQPRPAPAEPQPETYTSVPAQTTTSPEQTQPAAEPTSTAPTPTSEPAAEPAESTSPVSTNKVSVVQESQAEEDQTVENKVEENPVETVPETTGPEPTVESEDEETEPDKPASFWDRLRETFNDARRG